MPGFYVANDKTMESISVKPIRIRKKRVCLNPLRNPISSLHQWTALKAEGNDKEGVETGSYQPFLEKGCNPLLNPVSDIHEWRALKDKDAKPLMNYHQQPLPKAHSYQRTALKAEEDNGKEDIETGSYPPFLEKGSDPLLNPVSDIHEWRASMTKESKLLMTDHQQPLLQAHSYQWTALKAEEDNGKEDVETWSFEPLLEKGSNPLLNPVSDIHEWRALMAKDSKPWMTDHHQPLRKAQSHNSNPSFEEFDEEIAVDSSLSCWLSSSSSSENKATK